MNIRKGSWIEIASEKHQLNGFTGKITNIQKQGTDVLITLNAGCRLPEESEQLSARYSDTVIRYPETNFFRVKAKTVHNFKETTSGYKRIK